MADTGQTEKVNKLRTIFGRDNSRNWFREIYYKEEHTQNEKRASRIIQNTDKKANFRSEAL